MHVRKAMAALVITFWVGGCEWVLGIEEGTVRPESPPPDCTTAGDCPVDEAACRSVVSCSGGKCVYQDKPEGTPLASARQKPGDCLDLVCDGRGLAKQNPAATDNDDDNPCTEDSCNGVTPVHEKLIQGPCYSGPPGTENIGTCKGGIQQCDPDGNAVGDCMGASVPKDHDICENGADDECNGVVDDICVCGDGILQPEIGEECDDGGTADGDPCSPTCKELRVFALSTGYDHTCAILSGGVVKCWGSNGSGQLGLEDTNPRGDQPGEMGQVLPAVDLGSGRHASSIFGGGYQTCALLDNGSVKCWGRNDVGQLGLGDVQNRGDGPGEMGDALQITSLGAPPKPFSIAISYAHTCARFDDGRVKCWGWNSWGQLGLGNNVNRGDGPNEMGTSLPFVDVGSDQTALAIVTGFRYTCALLPGGTVKCWGDNEYGELGLGDTLGRGANPGEMGETLPVISLGMNQVATTISSTHRHTCVLLDLGTAKCWGWNNYGQLGLGDTNNRGDHPGEVGDALALINLGSNATITQISAGGGHTCVLLNDGRIKCWGAGGALGLGDTFTRGTGPGQMGDSLAFVELGGPATAIATGFNHTCALLTNGSVKCWGANNYGQLGLGDTNNRGDEPNEMGANLPTVKLFSDQW